MGNVMKRAQPSTVSVEEAKALAQQAYVFGFPLVYMEVQVDRSTQVTKPTGPLAPLGQWAHFRKLPDASDRTVVGMNLDVLLSMAQLDLGKGPMVLSVPDISDRFWSVMWLDAWNNVPFVIGTRATKGKGGNYAIVGPSWRGTLPPGVTEVRIPTNIAMLGARLRIENPEQTAAINALQDQLRLVPLEAFGSNWQPPAEVPLKPGVDAKTPVPDQILRMRPEKFFNRLNALLPGNPAYPEDAPLLARIAKLGIVSGSEFPWTSFSPEVQSAIAEGIKAGVQQIKTTPTGENVNGWMLTRDMGRFGTKYALRAAWTLVGVGGNLVEDACYPMSRNDGDGKVLDGKNRYRLRFPDKPPVEAFWSLYLYKTDGFLVDNPLNRYMLGSRSKLAYGKDGSLTIAIQREKPAAADTPDTNWLPGPAEGPFMIAMRLYLPKPEVSSGQWKPPAIERVN
jgi:hypothetical protein